MKKSRIVSLVLAISMIAGCMNCVWAKSVSGTEYEGAITTSGGSATTPVELTQDALEFSVTVPTSIPVHVDSSGNVTMPESIDIINNTFAPIEIKNIQITGKNGWTKTADTSGWQANDKKFVMTLDYEGDQVTNWTFAVAPRTTSLSGAEIADVVFTVGWADVQSGTTSTNPDPNSTPSPSSISLNQATATLFSNSSPMTMTLSVNGAPEGTTVIWNTSDDSVATVDENGVVTARSNGTATITATVGSMSADCIVTVTRQVTGGGGNNY